MNGYFESFNKCLVYINLISNDNNTEYTTLFSKIDPYTFITYFIKDQNVLSSSFKLKRDDILTPSVATNYVLIERTTYYKAQNRPSSE